MLFPCPLPFFFRYNILYFLLIFSCEGNLLHTLWLLCCVLPACSLLCCLSLTGTQLVGHPFLCMVENTGWFGLELGKLLFFVSWKWRLIVLESHSIPLGCCMIAVEHGVAQLWRQGFNCVFFPLFLFFVFRFWRRMWSHRRRLWWTGITSWLHADCSLFTLFHRKAAAWIHNTVFHPVSLCPLEVVFMGFYKVITLWGKQKN